MCTTPLANLCLAQQLAGEYSAIPGIRQRDLIAHY